MGRLSYLLLFLSVITAFLPLSISALEIQDRDRSHYPIKIEVTEEAGNKVWTRDALQKSVLYLTALDVCLGFPAWPAKGFALRGVREAVIRHEGHPLNGVRIGGYNWGTEVVVESALSTPENPALLWHELGHFYFDSRLQWMSEGIVSYLPLFMADSGVLELTAPTRRTVMNYWGLFTLQGADRPVNDYPYTQGADARGFYYAKTAKVQYILHKELGSEKYGLFLRQYLSVQKTADLEEVLGILNKLKPRDWRGFFSGWVTAGPYKDYTMADFADPDCDGLSGVDERAAGTDPHLSDTDGDLIPDGAELKDGLDPIKPMSPADARALLLTNGPYADGSAADWDPFARVFSMRRAYADPANPYMLKALAYTVHGGFFWLQAGPADKGFRDTNYFFDLLVDTNADGRTDLEFAFNFIDPGRPWFYQEALKKSTMPYELRSGMGGVYEIGIPLDLIGARRFAVLPIVRDGARKINADEWPRWEKIDLDTAAGVVRYGLTTDLRLSDADSDGIPDYAELSAGLDPQKPDGEKELLRTGPYVDGVSFEWPYMKALVYNDSRGETNIRGADLRSFWLKKKDGRLFIMAATDGAPAVLSNVMFDVMVDSDLDGSTDLEFAFMLTAPENPWRYSYRGKKSDVPAGLLSAMGQVFEMSIPLEFIGAKGTFAVMPMIYDLTERKPLDQWDSWIKVEP